MCRILRDRRSPHDRGLKGGTATEQKNRAWANGRGTLPTPSAGPIERDDPEKVETKEEPRRRSRSPHKELAWGEKKKKRGGDRKASTPQKHAGLA